MIVTDAEVAFYFEIEEFREVATAGAALSGRIRWKVVRMVNWRESEILYSLRRTGIEPGCATA